MNKKLIILSALTLASVTVLAEPPDDRRDRLDRREVRMGDRRGPGPGPAPAPAPAPRRDDDRRDDRRGPPVPPPPPMSRRDDDRRDDRRGPPVPPPMSRRDDRRDGPRELPPHLRPRPIGPVGPGPSRRWGPPPGRSWGRNDWGTVRVDRWAHRFEDQNWMRRRYDARASFWLTNRVIYRTFAQTWWDDYYRMNRVPRYGVGSFMLGSAMLSDDYRDYDTVDVFGAYNVSQIRVVALRDGATVETLQLKLCGSDPFGNPRYKDVPLNVRLLENQSTNWIDVKEYYRVGPFTQSRPVCVESFSISGYGDKTGFDELWERDETQIVLIGMP